MNKENDNDLISREALKKAIIEHRYDYVEDNFFWTKLFDIIDHAPTVDVKDQIAGAYNEGYMCGNKEAEKARPQGEWIGNKFDEHVCNKCGNYALYEEESDGQYYEVQSNFCPNCGAKMQS